MVYIWDPLYSSRYSPVEKFPKWLLFPVPHWRLHSPPGQSRNIVAMEEREINLWLSKAAEKKINTDLKYIGKYSQGISANQNSVQTAQANWLLPTFFRLSSTLLPLLLALEAHFCFKSSRALFVSKHKLFKIKLEKNPAVYPPFPNCCNHIYC